MSINKDKLDEESLYYKLIQHNENNVYPMHMPGHKRNVNIMSMVNPYSIDITEIDGFDNMHNPKGIIKKIEEDANELYGSKKTWLLVNGSSIGLMAAISATTKKGDTILIARNSHKSIYNAIELNELNPEYIYPEYIGCGINGEVFLTDIEKKIKKHPDVRVVVVTNPTYEGVISDIESIATYLHSRGIILIVDAAHGAHLGFNEEFPQNAIKLGADIVIHSIHKTLPAFTQTSLIHVTSDERVDISRLDKYISMFQSTSPSYIFMAGIENCIKVVRKSSELFKEFNNNLDGFYRKAKKLKNITILGYKKNGKNWRDKSKIVIISNCSDSQNFGGNYIYNQLLYKYKIQLEMKSTKYALAMTSICDTKEGFDKLLESLVKIDRDMEQEIRANICKNVGNSVDNVDNSNVEKQCICADWDYGPSEICNYKQYPPYKTQELLITTTNIWESVDKISAEYVYLYPPDIPLIVPGEIITKEFIETIKQYKENGLNVEGLEGNNGEYIRVVGDE